MQARALKTVTTDIQWLWKFIDDGDDNLAPSESLVPVTSGIVAKLKNIVYLALVDAGYPDDGIEEALRNAREETDKRALIDDAELSQAELPAPEARAPPSLPGAASGKAHARISRDSSQSQETRSVTPNDEAQWEQTALCALSPLQPPGQRFKPLHRGLIFALY